MESAVILIVRIFFQGEKSYVSLGRLKEKEKEIAKDVEKDEEKDVSSGKDAERDEQGENENRTKGDGSDCDTNRNDGQNALKIELNDKSESNIENKGDFEIAKAPFSLPVSSSSSSSSFSLTESQYDHQYDHQSDYRRWGAEKFKKTVCHRPFIFVEPLYQYL